MKRTEIIRRIEEMGCVFIRHGKRHDWYQNPVTKMAQPVPGHTEIKDSLAQAYLEDAQILSLTIRSNRPR